MNVTISPGPVSGTCQAIPSKSAAHRLLICAALARTPTTVVCSGTSQDITATLRCLTGLGAEISGQEEGYLVHPIPRPLGEKPCLLPCGESGSTLRFLLPVAGALGASAVFPMEGRLGQRPMGPLEEALTQGGCTIERTAGGKQLAIQGQLRPGDYTLPGDVSSQFISGLLFALPLLPGESRLHVQGPLESAGYIDLTLDALKTFGVQPVSTQDGWIIAPGGYTSPGTVTVEGDWSNAAPWLCMGALGGSGVTVTGVEKASLQGDRGIAQVLARMGAQVDWKEKEIRTAPGTGQPTEIDARDIPDLVPVLAAAAAGLPGVTRITGAARLRLKESDRLETTARTLNALGGQVEQLEDGLVITGGHPLTGGIVDAAGDHRIVMAAAVASVLCQGPVTVTGAQAVDKSYPAFWDHLEAMGKTVTRQP